jgi:ketosteroid isomerase-like protein
MNWKALAALSVALLLPVPARSEDTAGKQVVKALDALNKAFENGDAKSARALMTDDHVAVTSYYGGALSRDALLKSLPDHKLLEYKAGKMNVRLLGKDTALITYDLGMKGTYKGKPVPVRSHASSIWVNKGGKWLEAHYQETALPGKEGARPRPLK